MQIMIYPFLGRRHISEHMYTLVPWVKIGLFMDDKNSNSNNIKDIDKEIMAMNGKLF